MWKLTFGKIPEGLHVCHKCDNRGCVNPDHLFLGTPADNIKDMISKGRDFNRLQRKLTPDVVAAIRADAANMGYGKYSQLARKYNIADTNIRKVLPQC